MGKYPSKKVLKEITKLADKLPTSENIENLLKMIEQQWWMPERHFILKGKRVLRLYLCTGGWSGNEDIIGALKGTMFWCMFWEKSVRGGHYYFVIKEVKKK